MKKSIKIAFYVITSLILLGIIFATTDYFRTKADKKPIFALAFVQDTGNINYWGLGYKVVKCANNWNCGAKDRYVFGFYNMKSNIECSNDCLPVEYSGNGEPIDNEIIEPMKAASKIIIYPPLSYSEARKNVLGTITDKKEIDEVVDIVSRLVIPNGEYFDCDGNKYDLEMYDTNDKLIDTIYVWGAGRETAIPKSVHSGCAKMNLTTKDSNALNSIITKNINN